MLSIYIHIPFCNQKCKYCSFNIFSVKDLDNSQKIVDNYLSSLEKEINFYSNHFGRERVKSIYFGGGTPNKIGSKNIIKIIETIKNKFNLDDISELSIEFNPYPQNEIYEMINELNKKYKEFPRLRYSFGIQSFDNEILKESGRDTNFLEIVDFLRGLQKIKQENNLFNFDFIAFGKFNQTRSGNKQLRNQNALEFFQNFVNSLLADSFSLYTLELFPGSLRYHEQSKGLSTLRPDDFKTGGLTTDDDIYEEFSTLKDIILDAGYSRYELSNFSKLGKNSIHNRTYRNMENYIGLGVSGSSFLNSNIENYSEFIKNISIKDNKEKGLRFTNTQIISDYINGNFIDKNNIQTLNNDDYLIEKFFLGLRTDQGIQNIDNFKAVLVPNYQSLITNYEKNGFCNLEGETLKLTDQGMDVFNSIVTDLLEKI